MAKNTLRSTALSASSAGFVSGPERVVSLDQIALAKKGSEKAQLYIIKKIRAYVGVKKYNNDSTKDQWYMSREDINQVIDLKILEAIHKWVPGRCDFPTLASEYIKRALDPKYVGSSYYEGQKSNIFKTQHVQELDQPKEGCKLDMNKLREALGNDRMYFALRLSMGLNGTDKMSFNHISDIIYGHSGEKVSRQAIHSLVKRAKAKLKKVFSNEKEIIIYEKTET